MTISEAFSTAPGECCGGGGDVRKQTIWGCSCIARSVFTGGYVWVSVWAASPVG